MAFKNKTIRNSKTGQDITFLQTRKDTNGELLEMKTTYSAHSKEPPPHYHPYQTENFTVLTGEVMVRMNGNLDVLKQGDTLEIHANKVHSMWNDADQKAVVSWKVRPAMQTEYLLETGIGLANDGKTNKNGMPNLLQVVLMANNFRDVYRLQKPPYFLQRILFTILTPFAYLSGYKPTYKKYLD